MSRKSLCFVILMLAIAAVLTPASYGIMATNDDCQNAISIGEVTNLEFDLRGTTFDGPGHYIHGAPNIWYRYTASCSGNVIVNLSGSDFDTMVAVYDGGSCYPASDDLISGNDNYHGSLQSRVDFTAVSGHSYLIEIGGHDSAVDVGLLNVTCDGQSPPPPPPGPEPPASNDDCDSAQSVGNVSDLSFDTTEATFDGPGLCITSPNLWYCYTATCTGDVTVSLLGSSFDTMLAVYDGCACNPTSGRLIECNDDSGSFYQSEITFAAVEGNQYLIEVGGYGSDTGEGVLNINCTSMSTTDDCADADHIGNVTDLAFDTTGATFDGPGHCMTSPNIWYVYTAPCTDNVTVSLLGSGYDTVLAVYKGDLCYPAVGDLIECNDDFGSFFQSEVTFAAVAGKKYLIEVGGYGSETGQGILNINCGGVSAPGKRDLGDAPDSTNSYGTSMTAYTSSSVQGNFPTVYNDGSGYGPYGPVHVNAQAVAYLGKTITGENEADNGPDDDGINNIRPLLDSSDRDEGDNGISLPLSLPACDWATIDYSVTVVNPGTDLWVNIWLDFNRDGDWDDTLSCTAGPVPEWAVQNQLLFNLPAGLNQLTSSAFRSWHPNSGPKDIWMRITLSDQPWKGGSNPGEVGNGGSGPLAKYAFGETEDYHFTPDTTDQTDCPLCQDINGDGTVDVDDLAAFTALWLANCP